MFAMRERDAWDDCECLGGCLSGNLRRGGLKDSSECMKGRETRL